MIYKYFYITNVPNKLMLTWAGNLPLYVMVMLKTSWLQGNLITICYMSHTSLLHTIIGCTHLTTNMDSLHGTQKLV